MDEPIVIQARKKYRIKYLSMWIWAIALCSFLGLIFLTQERGRLPKITLFLIFVVIPGFVGLHFNWKPPNKLKFILHADSISGSIGNQTFQLLLAEILHVENLNYALRIDTTNSQLLLQKSHFDLEQIHKELKKRLHPDVFIDGGWVNLPAYQPIKEQQDALYSDLLPNLPFHIKQDLPIVFKVLITISIILFSAATLFSWQQFGYDSLLFLFFSVLGVILLLRQGILKVDSHQISYETKFRKYRILWENVTRVEHDDQLAFAFLGQNQCLKIPWSHEFRWDYKQKEAFYFFLDHTIKQKNIEQRQSQWASVHFNKNTRIPK